MTNTLPPKSGFFKAIVTDSVQAKLDELSWIIFIHHSHIPDACEPLNLLIIKGGTLLIIEKM